MKLFRWLAALVAVVTLNGCASTAALTPAAGTADLSRYHAIVVDSVRLAPAVSATLSAEEVQTIERQLHLALVDALPPTARAATPAPGVLRLAVTVTDLESVSPTLNAVTTVLLFVPLDKGGVAFEAVFSNESGSPLSRTTQHHTSTPLEIKGSFSRYGHAEKALRTWAAELAKALAPA